MVVFPAPLGPSSEKVVPSAISRSIPSRTVLSPKDLRSPVTFNADGSWSYVSDTMLSVRGQAAPFRHRDRNTLLKVAEPTPNPLALIRAATPA